MPIINTVPCSKIGNKITKEKLLLHAAALSFLSIFMLNEALAESKAARSFNCSNSENENELLSCRENENLYFAKNLEEKSETIISYFSETEPEKAKLLREAQQRWYDFRDSECKLLTYESQSGSAYMVYLYSCLTDMNKKRMEQIELLISAP